MTGHEIGLLKAYMQDLVEQAQQESTALKIAGYQERDYSPDEAIMDLLALLDDRVESEGVQVGLSESFTHLMWETCQRCRDHIKDTAWLTSNIEDQPMTKHRIRQIAYAALIEYIETEVY